MNDIIEKKHNNEDRSHNSLVVVTDDKDRTLILKRPSTLPPEKYPSLWGLPGGGSLAGEDPMATALRETQEETGIVFKRGDLKFLSEKDRGDKKIFFYKAFTNEQPKLENVLDEHVAFRWIGPDEIKNYKMIKDTAQIIKDGLTGVTE